MIHVSCLVKKKVHNSTLAPGSDTYRLVNSAAPSYMNIFTQVYIPAQQPNGPYTLLHIKSPQTKLSGPTMMEQAT